MATTKFIQSSAHTIVGESGSTAAVLEPGGRVPLNEDAASHKYLAARIEAGDPDYAHLSVVEVDLEDERNQQEEQQQMLEQAAEIAAEARNEQLRELEERQDTSTEGVEGIEGETPPIPQVSEAHIPPQDKESVRLAGKSGAGQRATTQEDVADEDKPRGRGRKS